MTKLFSKQNRALLSELVRTDFKLRYQGSVLGYAWSLLKPLFMFLILYLVFAVIFKFGDDVPNYPIYLLLGIVLWNFFAEITQQSLGSIVGRGDLIRKIRIPRWMIVMSSSVSAMINLGLNLLVVMLFAFINNLDFLITSPLLILYIIEIYIFALGLSLLLAALYVKYRDVSYIWDVLLQAGFYATPILYPLTLIPNETVREIMFLNPIAHAVQGSREAFVTNQTISMPEIWGGFASIVIPVVITGTFLLFGVMYFRSQAENFAENL